MFAVDVAPGPEGPRRVFVRELRGGDELGAEPSGAAHPLWAVELLSSVLVQAPGASVIPDPWDLTLPDRDRVLAAVHARAFGRRVESRVRCRACGEPFDLSFDLGELVASMPLSQRPDGEGRYEASDGRRFRLPTLRDQGDVATLTGGEAARELARRCGGGESDFDLLEAEMERVAPLLDVDLAASCAVCASEQTLRFEISAYLHRTLVREREVLLREIHLLAATYRWSLDAILSLPRSQRHRLVALVCADRAAGWGAS